MAQPLGRTETLHEERDRARARGRAAPLAPGVGSESAARLARSSSRQWLALAAGSLLLSGLLAVFLALARTPLIDGLISDPLFFRRGLVVHVDLALLVWIYSMVAALYTLLPVKRGSGALERFSAGTSITLGYGGVLLLLLGAGAKGSEPILSNYVPVIDHPIFFAGLCSFAAGVLLSLVNRRLLPSHEAELGPVGIPAAGRVALRTAALAVLLALLSFMGSWFSTSRTFVPAAYFENLFWGGGHVLQVASVSAMIAAWLMLLGPVVDSEILSRRAATILFGLLLAPILAAPLLAARGPVSPWYRIGFTKLMQWGIFPVVCLVLLYCSVALVRAKRRGEASLRDGRVLGFATSAGLTVLGFLLGAMIRGSNTMIPAHYHAAIGGVSAAFMAVTFTILPPLGIPLRWQRLARFQPAVFGLGQAVFALGFGFAGWFGMGRKVYGAEQLHRSLPETIGLAVMGAGGLVAAVGGIAFLLIVFLSWRASAVSARRHPERSSWLNSSSSLPKEQHHGP